MIKPSPKTRSQPHNPIFEPYRPGQLGVTLGTGPSARWRSSCCRFAPCLLPEDAPPELVLATALTPETRARAAAVAGMIRTDGATVAAKLLLESISRDRPPASA
jgi:hypothetical protein